MKCLVWMGHMARFLRGATDFFLLRCPWISRNTYIQIWEWCRTETPLMNKRSRLSIVRRPMILMPWRGRSMLDITSMLDIQLFILSSTRTELPKQIDRPLSLRQKVKYGKLMGCLAASLLDMPYLFNQIDTYHSFSYCFWLLWGCQLF